MKVLNNQSLSKQDINHIKNIINVETDPLSKILLDIIKITIPMIIFGFSFQFPSVMDYRYAGLLDSESKSKDYSNAYGMGFLIFYCTGSIFGDISVGLETLISQAYGQKNFRRLASLSLLTIFMLECLVPVFGIFYYFSQ